MQGADSTTEFHAQALRSNSGGAAFLVSEPNGRLGNIFIDEPMVARRPAQRCIVRAFLTREGMRRAGGSTREVRAMQLSRQP